MLLCEQLCRILKGILDFVSKVALCILKKKFQVAMSY